MSRPAAGTVILNGRFQTPVAVAMRNALDARAVRILAGEPDPPPIELPKVKETPQPKTRVQPRQEVTLFRVADFRTQCKGPVGTA